MAVIAPRPRGRVGAGALIAVAILALTQALGNGSPVKTAYARPWVPSFEATVSKPEKALLPGSFSPLQFRVQSALELQVAAGKPTVQVPILMYHYIRVNPDPRDKMGYNLSVTPDDFRAQMDWLADNGWHPITLTTLRTYYDGTPLPAKPVVLTFDDGYLDFYTTAFPILQQHHFPAVSYVVAGFIGWPGRYVTAAQIQELDRAGIEIGAHTVSHSTLTRLSTDSLRHELMDSKVTLEGLVGHQVLDFCYPSGEFDARVVQMVADQGYQSATTTREGVAHSSNDRFTWTRTRVSGGESLDDFGKALARHEEGAGSAAPSVLLPRVYPFFYLRPGVN